MASSSPDDLARTTLMLVRLVSSDFAASEHSSLTSASGLPDASSLEPAPSLQNHNICVVVITKKSLTVPNVHLVIFSLHASHLQQF